MNEEWRDIEGYEERYQVSNLGRVKSLRNSQGQYREKILTNTPDKIGYLTVGLSKNGKRKNFKVHRLVAEAFIENPNNHPIINHKDENKQNNCVNNLEWCTYKYNNTYGTRTQRASEKMSQNHADFSGSKNGRARKVKCVTTGKEFECIKDAAEHYKFNNPSKTNISACCIGKRNYCGKHPVTGEKLVWKYID